MPRAGGDVPDQQLRAALEEARAREAQARAALAARADAEEAVAELTSMLRAATADSERCAVVVLDSFVLVSRRFLPARVCGVLAVWARVRVGRRCFAVSGHFKWLVEVLVPQECSGMYSGSIWL